MGCRLVLMQVMEMDLVVEMVEVMEFHMVEKAKQQVMERAEAMEHFVAAEWYEDVAVEQLALWNYHEPLLSAKTLMVKKVMDLQDLGSSINHQCHHEHQGVSQKLMKLAQEANDTRLDAVM